MKLKKVAITTLSLSLSPPHLSRPSMHEVVGGNILTNTFSKIAQFHLENCS